jgi:hypothetical protein
MRHVRVLAFALLAFAAPAAAASERPRAVIELFTSQGCSACPAADRLLAEYARDPSVLALSYSVQIWDHLGWRDTLATPETTARQKAYADARGDRQVYTPQAVVNGMFHVLGSSREDIEARRAPSSKGAAARALSVPVDLTRQGGRLVIAVGAGRPAAARVVVVTFDRVREVPIGRGENEGRTIAYRHAVRSILDAGPWTGAPVTLGVDLPAGEDVGAAALLQEQTDSGGPGVVLGAAQLR